MNTKADITVSSTKKEILDAYNNLLKLFFYSDCLVIARKPA